MPVSADTRCHFDPPGIISTPEDHDSLIDKAYDRRNWSHQFHSLELVLVLTHVVPILYGPSSKVTVTYIKESLFFMASLYLGWLTFWFRLIRSSRNQKVNQACHLTYPSNSNPCDFWLWAKLKWHRLVQVPDGDGRRLRGHDVALPEVPVSQFVRQPGEEWWGFSCCE